VQTSQHDGMMRFFLPAKHNTVAPPQPLDARVQLLAVPARTIAALRYSGARGNAADKDKSFSKA